MRYKVGDKVRVKSREWYEANQIEGEVDCGGLPFTPWLSALCGTIQTVEGISQDFGGSYYTLENVPYLWNDLMFEDTVDFPLENVPYLWNDLMFEDTVDFPLDDDKALYDELDEVYWANMQHQYAGMAMQTLMPQYEKMYNCWVEEQMQMDVELTPAQADKAHEEFAAACADLSALYADALVKRLKRR